MTSLTIASMNKFRLIIAVQTFCTYKWQYYWKINVCILYYLKRLTHKKTNYAKKEETDYVNNDDDSIDEIIYTNRLSRKQQHI